MPPVLNLCLKGKQTILCSLLFLSFTPLHASPTPSDTIGRKKDINYKKELREWRHHENEVNTRYRQLTRQQQRLAAQGKSDTLLNQRVTRLKKIVATLDFLRHDDSPYYYIVKTVPSTQSAGATVYDTASRYIVFGIQDGDNNTYSFVHEVTHGLQFAQGQLVFNKSSGLSIGDDIGDELEAYRNQFAYDTSSVSGIHDFAAIDSAWLRSLKDRDSVPLYSPKITGKYNTIGLTTVTVDSDTVALRAAYPAITSWGDFRFPLKDATHFIFRVGSNNYSTTGNKIHDGLPRIGRSSAPPDRSPDKRLSASRPSPVPDPEFFWGTVHIFLGPGIRPRSASGHAASRGSKTSPAFSSIRRSWDEE
ncbi:hypothetical protein ACQ86N_38685 [Puia sp. P3]|uniref:hypothetical protein n=1 Tax=Puia sp. P3 TaxID=3423952 RepID=UPI003D67774A